MLYVGIHVGPELIRVSQLHKGREAPLVEPKTLPNYGIEKWYSDYQGCLPNRFCPSSNRFGYDSLEDSCAASVTSLDRNCLQALLEDDEGAEQAGKTWRGFLNVVRRQYFPGEKEPLWLTLYFEGFSFRAPRSKFAFWRTPEDHTPRLGARLLELSRHFAIQQINIASSQDSLVAWNHLSNAATIGTVVVITGAIETGVWTVDPVGSIGVLRKIQSTVGFRAPPEAENLGVQTLGIDSRRSNGHSADTILLDTNTWQGRVCQDVASALRMVQGHRIEHIVLVGEGSDMLQDALRKSTGLNVSMPADPAFLHSHGAAIISYQQSGQTE